MKKKISYLGWKAAQKFSAECYLYKVKYQMSESHNKLLREEYDRLLNCRYKLITAEEKIKSMESQIDSLKAEIQRLQQVAQY